MASPELEMLFEIWCGSHHYQVGYDRDGLDMVEIRYYDGEEAKSKLRMAFSQDEAKMIHRALGRLLSE